MAHVFSWESAGNPNAVADALQVKNDLGIHTEMLTTGMMKLAKMGVVTGKNKQFEKGKIVTTFAMGTKELVSLWI